MVKYEDVLREITVLSNKKIRNEERIKQLNEQNNSINSSLKILTSKKEMFEKLNSDLESVLRKKKKKEKKEKNTDELVQQSEECVGNNAEQNVASNVFWGHSPNKHGL